MPRVLPQSWRDDYAEREGVKVEAERAEDPVGGPEAAVTGKPRLRQRRWFRVLAAGVFFIALMEASYLAYPNPNLVPAIIVYAAFLVPVVFMVHLHERLEATELPVASIVVCFISAGAVGLAFASTVLALFVPQLGFFKFLVVGPVEETAKMIVPLAVCALGAYRSEGAGVMVGLVSAMAFSALETAGYGFNAFLGNFSGGDTGRVADLFEGPVNLVALDANVVARSLFSPVGHATWTMLVCFALFHESTKAGRFVINGRVILAFVLASLLHACWDTTLGVPPEPAWGKALGWVAFAATAALTVWLMKRIIRRTREEMGAGRGSPT